MMRTPPRRLGSGQLLRPFPQHRFVHDRGARLPDRRVRVRQGEGDREWEGRVPGPHPARPPAQGSAEPRPDPSCSRARAGAWGLLEGHPAVPGIAPTEPGYDPRSPDAFRPPPVKTRRAPHPAVAGRAHPHPGHPSRSAERRAAWVPERMDIAAPECGSGVRGAVTGIPRACGVGARHARSDAGPRRPARKPSRAPRPRARVRRRDRRFHRSFRACPAGPGVAS